MASLAAGMVVGSSVRAHPMPNTVIAVALDDRGARFDIAVPLPDLLLALPEDVARDRDLLSAGSRQRLVAYFNEHLTVTSREGRRQPHIVESFALSQAEDSNVGRYQELQVRVRVPLAPGFDARTFTLAYDAIIHRVPTHYALVQVVRDFRSGLVADAGAADLGVIHFDFSTGRTWPLEVTMAPGSLWRGFRAMASLGFRHVGAGLDHVLFLVTLLVVAPLKVVAGRWSLFQGWGFAVRRFVAISLAFTVGHSVALLLGTYELVSVGRAAVETLVAASILLAAAHAIRPMFAGREWLVAGTFGTVHGLAFSESLMGLDLSPLLKGLSVVGFNLGVEAAQLSVMAAALPALMLSQWPVFHRVRVVAMALVAAVAAVWVLERAGQIDLAAATATESIEMRPVTLPRG